MKYGARVQKYDWMPREAWADSVAELVWDTVMHSNADHFRISVVETNEEGEPLAD